MPDEPAAWPSASMPIFDVVSWDVLVTIYLLSRRNGDRIVIETRAIEANTWKSTLISAALRAGSDSKYISAKREEIPVACFAWKKKRIGMSSVAENIADFDCSDSPTISPA